MLAFVLGGSSCTAGELHLRSIGCDALRIRGKSSDADNNLDFASREGASELAASFQRSSDGISADGELTPNTRKTALEAMRTVLQRAEFTPRSPPADEDGFGMEDEPEDDVTRKLHTRFLEAARSGNFRGVVESLAEGADLHCVTARGQTALMLAAACRGQSSLQIIGFLVEPRTQESGMPPRNDACRMQLRCRIDVEALDHLSWTALLHACRNDMKEARQLAVLLEDLPSLPGSRAAAAKPGQCQRQIS